MEMSSLSGRYAWPWSPSVMLFVCAACVCFLAGNEAHLIKIALPAVTVSGETHVSRRATAACEDYSEVNTTSLSAPEGFESLPKPWIDGTLDVKAYWSATVSSGIEHLLNLTVPGLDGSTVRDVFDYLKVQGPCLIFPFGGVVRDQFLGKPSNDVDAEISCSANRARALCTKRWGADSCQDVTDPDLRSGYTYIGSRTASVSAGDTQGIDMAIWELTFFAKLTDFEYTANSLAYDMYGSQVVLDLTSTGVADACAKKIRIPTSNFSLWDSWKTDQKVYRYWKLRVKGFSSVDSATEAYIVSEAKSFIAHRGETFTMFYCSYVLTGRYIDLDNSCSFVECSHIQAKVQLYSDFFSSDMGSFWNQTAKPVADSLRQKCESSGRMTALTPSLLLFLIVNSVAAGIIDGIVRV